MQGRKKTKLIEMTSGKNVIKCKVVYSKRKTAAIHITPDAGVELRVPLGTSDINVAKMLESKSAWVLSKLMVIESQVKRRNETKYENGSVFYLLGEKYHLRIFESKGKVEIVLNGDELQVHAKDPIDQNKIKALIDHWYLKMAQQVFEKRVEGYQHFFEVKPSKVIAKYQKSRYGSCNVKRELRFNYNCVQLPLDIVDYLVVHEMSHMVHMNHSKAFWDLVCSIIPDAREKRKKLKEKGAHLL